MNDINTEKCFDLLLKWGFYDTRCFDYVDVLNLIKQLERLYSGGVVYFIKPFPNKSLLKIGMTRSAFARFYSHRRNWPDMNIIAIYHVSKDVRKHERRILESIKEGRLGKKEVFRVERVHNIYKHLAQYFFTVEDEVWNSDGYVYSDITVKLKRVLETCFCKQPF